MRPSRPIERSVTCPYFAGMTNECRGPSRPFVLYETARGAIFSVGHLLILLLILIVIRFRFPCLVHSDATDARKVFRSVTARKSRTPVNFLRGRAGPSESRQRKLAKSSKGRTNSDKILPSLRVASRAATRRSEIVPLSRLG